MRGSMQGRGAKGRIGREGGGKCRFSSFCPVLNPVVPVQRTCLFRGKMCVAVLNVGRRRATRHWRDWQTVILWVDTGACVYIRVCVCVRVCCVPLTYFLGSRVYMCGHESRTGSSQSLWCWSSMLNPSSSTPSIIQAYMRIHTSTQTDAESALRQPGTHFSHACLHTQNTHMIVFLHTYEYTLFLPYREKWAARFKTYVLTRTHETIKYNNHEEAQAAVSLGWMQNVSNDHLMWCFLLFCFPTCSKIHLRLCVLKIILTVNTKTQGSIFKRLMSINMYRYN